MALTPNVSYLTIVLNVNVDQATVEIHTNPVLLSAVDLIRIVPVTKPVSTQIADYLALTETHVLLQTPFVLMKITKPYVAVSLALWVIHTFLVTKSPNQSVLWIVTVLRSWLVLKTHVKTHVESFSRAHHHQFVVSLTLLLLEL